MYFVVKIIKFQNIFSTNLQSPILYNLFTALGRLKYIIHFSCNKFLNNFNRIIFLPIIILKKRHNKKGKIILI